MFSRIFRGHEVPHVAYKFDAEPPLRPDDARLAAWALALGQTRPSSHPPPPRRAHRGQLPDVDFSNVVRVPRRPGLFARLVSAFRGKQSASGPQPEEADMPLGYDAHKPYLAHVAQESAARRDLPAGDMIRNRAA
jgi:hypothetical protein